MTIFKKPVICIGRSWTLVDVKGCLVLRMPLPVGNVDRDDDKEQALKTVPLHEPIYRVENEMIDDIRYGTSIEYHPT